MTLIDGVWTLCGFTLNFLRGKTPLGRSGSESGGGAVPRVQTPLHPRRTQSQHAPGGLPALRPLQSSLHGVFSPKRVDFRSEVEVAIMALWIGRVTAAGRAVTLGNGPAQTRSEGLIGVGQRSRVWSSEGVWAHPGPMSASLSSAGLAGTKTKSSGASDIDVDRCCSHDVQKSS